MIDGQHARLAKNSFCLIAKALVWRRQWVVDRCLSASRHRRVSRRSGNTGKLGQEFRHAIFSFKKTGKLFKEALKSHATTAVVPTIGSALWTNRILFRMQKRLRILAKRPSLSELATFIYFELSRQTFNEVSLAWL